MVNLTENVGQRSIPVAVEARVLNHALRVCALECVYVIHIYWIYNVLGMYPCPYISDEQIT